MKSGSALLLRPSVAAASPDPGACSQAGAALAGWLRLGYRQYSTVDYQYSTTQYE